MSTNYKSIDIQEAESVARLITLESEKAREAIRNVMKSPERLTHWQGNRRRQFDSQIAVDMSKLQNAIVLIDDAANKIKLAIESFIGAD